MMSVCWCDVWAICCLTQSRLSMRNASVRHHCELTSNEFNGEVLFPQHFWNQIDRMGINLAFKWRHLHHRCHSPIHNETFQLSPTQRHTTRWNFLEGLLVWQPLVLVVINSKRHNVNATPRVQVNLIDSRMVGGAAIRFSFPFEFQNETNKEPNTHYFVSPTATINQSMAVILSLCRPSQMASGGPHSDASCHILGPEDKWITKVS